MKIGLVCPYIYPENGGVAQHVRFLYENLRLRGHDVRVLTASHGPQRSSEGDIIRLGVGFSVPADRATAAESINTVVRNLIDANKEVSRKNFLEVYHDSLEYKDECMTLFSLGHLSLAQRVVAEQAFWGLCQKILRITRELKEVPDELEGLEKALTPQDLADLLEFIES